MEKEEFLRLLPKLILEDNEVKGAIITALSGIVATKEDIAKQIEHSDRRFEAIQKQMDERFEAIQKQMDERFEAIQKQMDERFATKDDIAKQIEHSDRRFEAIDKRFEAMQKQMDYNYKDLRSSISNLGGRMGKSAEMAVLRLLKEENKLKEIEITKIEQLKLKDTEGVVFTKGYNTDIDILMENGKTILIEVKFKVNNRDLQHFFDAARLYEKLYKKPDELWVLTFEITHKTLKVAEELFPFKIIYGRIA